MDNDSFFLVQYRNGKATEIGIQRDLSKLAPIKLFGIDRQPDAQIFTGSGLASTAFLVDDGNRGCFL